MQQLVPEGYQQTEVGVIPDDWNLISIDQAIIEKIIVDQMDGNHGELYPKSHEFASFGVPYIGATDFYRGVINFNTCKYIPDKRAALFKKGVAKNGDVLFAHNATVGPVALVETDLDFIILSTTATYYRCDNKRLLNHYLKAFFGSSYFVGQYTAVMSQSTRNQVPILAQRKFLLVLPSFNEQTAIANALSDVDALITSLEKLIAKKRAMKTAAMQQLLSGKKRLPPFDQSHTGYTQTELGEIPEDWEVVRLGDICFFENGDRSSNYPSPGSFVGSGIPFVNAGHVSRGAINLAELNFITREAYELLGGGKICSGDILFCLRGSLGKYGIVPEGFGQGAIASSMVIIRPKSKVVTRGFLKSYFDSRLCKVMIELWAGGAAQPNLGAGEMAKFVVPLPKDVQEQIGIANALSDMDAEILSIEQRLKKTQQLKQGMMQELLTGRTRLI